MTFRGHGQPGLLDNLRCFSDLIDDSAASRRAFIDYTPAVQISTWAFDTGSTWFQRAHYEMDGMVRDIAGVLTDVGPLTRVDTVTDCRATAGSYFADVASAVIRAVPYWDDGVTPWDGGALYDQTSPLDLYVHLPSGENPNTLTVVAQLGFRFSGKGEVYPILGADALISGDSDVVAWGTETVTGAGFSSGLDTVIFKSGAASTKLVSTGAATGNVARRQDMNVVAGARYAFSGYYMTDSAFSGNLTVRIRVGDNGSTTFLYADGRDGDGAGGGVALTPTNGEWRAFWFDYVAPFATTRVQIQLIALSIAGAGQLNLDRLHHRRIYRYEFYEPRLAGGGVPTVDSRAKSLVAFGGKTKQGGDFTLNDGDGVLAPIFGQLLLHNNPAATLIGGAFGDGQEISRDDWRGASVGLAQLVEVTDATIKFQTEDARTILDTKIPPATHNTTDEPNLDASEAGSGHAVGFAPVAGPWITRKPTRVDLAAGTGYGIYEVLDGTRSLGGIDNGIPGGLSLAVYPSEELAGKEQLAYNVSGSILSFDPATGLMTILADIRNYGRGRDGTDLTPRMYFDFNIGAAAFVAVPAGVSGGITAAFLASALQTAMRTASGAGDINVTYSETTHLWTVSKGAGTLNLLCSTGVNSQLRAWEIIGFNTNTDRTAALSYVGDSATFTSPEADHVIRVTTAGFKDSGSSFSAVSGTTSLNISQHAYVAKYLLYQYGKVPLNQFNAAEFTAGAALEPTPRVAVVVRGEVSLSDALARLEDGAEAHLVVDGDGLWRWRPYSAAAASVRDFFDRDYLTWSISRDPKQTVYAKARVTYGQNAVRNTWRTYESIQDTSIPTKYGRQLGSPLEVLTWIGAVNSAAQPIGDRAAQRAAFNPRIAVFASRGKLVDLLIGDKIRLTRLRALDPTGALAAVAFIVKGLRHNYEVGVSECTAVEDVGV